MISVYVKPHGAKKFASINRFPMLSQSKAKDIKTVELWTKKEVAKYPTATFQIRAGLTSVLKEFKASTSTKAIEMPIGQNEGILKLMVDRMHVGQSYLAVVRYVVCDKMTMAKFRQVPRPLRRGLIKFVIEQHKANRRLYADVMGVKFSGVISNAS